MPSSRKTYWCPMAQPNASLFPNLSSKSLGSDSAGAIKLTYDELALNSNRVIFRELWDLQKRKASSAS